MVAVACPEPRLGRAGEKWIDAVPVVGFFCGYFHTPPGCAVLALRLGLARRLLMPGHGRWKVIPKAHRNPNEDPFSAEASIGLEHMVIDADGSLIEKPPEQVAETLSVGGLLGVLRFKTKLKRKAAKRLAKVQYQKVDLVKSAPLSVIVALSLKAQRAQAKTKSAKADDASKAVRGTATVWQSLSVNDARARRLAVCVLRHHPGARSSMVLSMLWMNRNRLAPSALRSSKMRTGWAAFSASLRRSP